MPGRSRRLLRPSPHLRARRGLKRMRDQSRCGWPNKADISTPQPRQAVLSMAPYSPPTGNRIEKLRLDFNENTIGSSEKVIAALRDSLTAERLSVYPDYSRVKQT